MFVPSDVKTRGQLLTCKDHVNTDITEFKLRCVYPRVRNSLLDIEKAIRLVPTAED